LKPLDANPTSFKENYMSIAIIGAGNVGSALCSAFKKQGHDVLLGVPSPDKYANLTQSLSVRLCTVKEAIRDSEMVILAVPYAAALDIAQEQNDWQGKVLIDATNPIATGLSGLSVGTTSSGAEEIAKLAYNARVVKAFNTTGAENMANSLYAQGAVLMPIAGDDADARTQVAALARSIGFDVADMGALNAARYIEPFAMTWIHLAIKQGEGRNFAFSRMVR
jgi:8-hydroxy-5-deazaflavin:NADPH oxidoreductase